MTAKIYCPCRDIILCKHYTHNHTSVKKYFATFQCCGKRNVKQSLSWTFDIMISIICILLKTQILVDTKKEQKPVAPLKSSAHCLANGGIQRDSRYCSFLTVHVEQTM